MPDETGRMTVAEAAYFAAAAPGLLLKHARFDPEKRTDEWNAALMSSQAVFRLLEEIQSLNDELRSRASVLTREAPPTTGRTPVTRRPGVVPASGAGAITGEVGGGGVA
jgi:hypothetical protein